MELLDILAMQECLDSYKKLLDWFPATDKYEETLREGRLKLIDSLIDKLEEQLEVFKNEDDGK